MNKNFVPQDIINRFYLQGEDLLFREFPSNLKELSSIRRGLRIKDKGTKSKRENIHARIISELYAECEGRCALCDDYDRRYLQIHHICPHGLGGNNDFWNLIAVCASCHVRIHSMISSVDSLIWSGRARELEIFGLELLAARLYELLTFNCLLTNDISEAALASWRKFNCRRSLGMTKDLEKIYKKHNAISMRYKETINRDREMCIFFLGMEEVPPRIRYGILFELACEQFEIGNYSSSRELLKEASSRISSSKMDDKEFDLSTADTLHLQSWLPQQNEERSLDSLAQAMEIYERYYSDATGRAALQIVAKLYQNGESAKGLRLAKDVIYQTEVIQPNTWLNFNLRSLVSDIWGIDIKTHPKSSLREVEFKSFVLPYDSGKIEIASKKG